MLKKNYVRDIVERNDDKLMYLFQLTGLDDRGVAVFIVGQAKQDVVTNRSRHDPGSLWREGDAAAVSDFALRWHQLTHDHHEQGTLEETRNNAVTLIIVHVCLVHAESVTVTEISHTCRLV